MKNILLYLGVALTLFGFVGRLYAATYTHVDANGILRDSIWLPIGSFMFIAGVFLLIGFAVCQVINSKKTRDQ